jgi:hypothetical protein
MTLQNDNMKEINQQRKELNEVKLLDRTALTVADIRPAKIGPIAPEFGTSDDVRKYFGIKKGTLYNLHKAGRVRGKVLRVTGEFKGVRIWDMASIRAFIESQENELSLAV